MAEKSEKKAEAFFKLAELLITLTGFFAVGFAALVASADARYSNNPNIAYSTNELGNWFFIFGAIAAMLSFGFWCYAYRLQTKKS